MTNVFRYFIRHKILTSVLIITVISIGLSLSVRSFDYNKVNEADMLHIYEEGVLIAALENPSSVLGVVEAIYITTPKQLGLSPFQMKELYALEYLTDGEVVSRMKIMSPRNDEAIAVLEKKSKLNEWIKLNGEFSVMRSRLCYFSLGKHYYSVLSEIVK